MFRYLLTFLVILMMKTASRLNLKSAEIKHSIQALRLFALVVIWNGNEKVKWCHTMNCMKFKNSNLRDIVPVQYPVFVFAQLQGKV